MYYGSPTISHHGKKTDKETQSQVLKLFRDMGQKEKHDPEKTNLLNGKHVEKKRKHFLGHRSKSDQKSVESSSTDVQPPYKQQEPELRSAEYHRSHSQSLPFQGSKSWVFWGSKDNSKKGRNDDTCSCVSCALKKLIGSDYACIGCLALLFSISVIVACLLVYNCIPTIANSVPKRDSERLKRKIDSINGWGSFMPKTFGFNKNKWHDSSFQDLGTIDADSELSKIIDDTKLSEIQSSLRLREFYKKLLKADSNLRKLKKNSDYIQPLDTNLDLDLKTLSAREKRSLSFLKKPLNFFHLRKNKANRTIKNKHKDKVANLTKIEKSRHKRLGNNPEDTVVIQKDQVVIQYKPRIFPKCSHNIPKDSRSHEHLMKHPFYKNTQKLDELLDQFNKNLPDIFNDEFGHQLNVEDKLYTKPNPGGVKNKIAVLTKNKMDKTEISNNEKVDINNYKTDYDMFRKMRNGFTNIDDVKTISYADFDGDALKRGDLTTNKNQNEKRTTPYVEQMERIPNLRRLLQSDDENEETVNYEDLKEVLADDNQAHDDSDKQSRKKRMDDFNFNNPMPTKYIPPNVNNPNWKGPMPLYPDEINSMIKQGPVVVNKVENPVNRDEIEEISDMDYMEDYLHSKYQGLANLAQAYSDYGVLGGQKGATEKNSNKMTEKRNKMAFGGAFGRRKKLSEGIRFEIHPTSTARDDNPANIYNFIEKHIKVAKNLYSRPGFVYSTVTVPGIEIGNNKYIRPLIEDGRSKKTINEATLYKVPLEYNINPIIDIRNDKNTKRNKKECPNDINIIAKLENDYKIAEQTVDNLNDNLKNENRKDELRFRKRSLKSFEATNSAQIDDKDKDFEIKTNDENGNSARTTDEKHLPDNENSKSEVIEHIPKENSSFNETNRSNMDLSDFFMMMSNIFSAFDKEDAITELYGVGNVSSISTTNQPKSKPKTTDIIYPMYDSDMFDNIGHRSRVLMSVNSTGTEEIEKEAVEDHEAKKQATNSTNPILSPNENLIKNKTARIVKRHANDNTIFWNDMYDDEYGVKMDVFDNIKDKSSMTSEFMRRSNQWIQDKVKKISDNFHKSTNGNDISVKRVGRSIGNRHINGEPGRSIMNPETNEDKRTDFNALTVHMKDVCRRAAHAVQDTGKTEDKDENANEATSGLMQQLVNLMTDLIDFQVEQRTCMKLPPDLHHFLDWLTDGPSKYTDDDTPPAAKLDTKDLPSEIRYDKPMSDHTMDMPSEREEQDPPSDCLGTLQALQELLRTFEIMPIDDKSKMTGVKEYLLNQITFLKKRLAEDKYNNLQYQEQYRYKRNLPTRRRHLKYIKNYSKKHTKTTASYYDGDTFSEPFDTLTRRKVNVKRNLRDIYYKAVADSKKITTVKNHH